MKNSFRFFLFFFLVIIAASCDLSKYPIDDPAQVKVDTRLLGKWKVKNKSGADEVYQLSQQNEFKYLVTKIEKKKPTEKHTAFLSNIDNALFLNVYCNDSGNEGYYFLEILDIDPKTNAIKVTSVTDSTVKYLYSPGEVRRWLTENLNNHMIFGDTTLFTKIK